MEQSIGKKFFRFAFPFFRNNNNRRATEGVEMLSPLPIAQRRIRRSKTISETLRRSTQRQRRPKLDRHFAGAIERYECRKLENAVVVHAPCITYKCNRINPDVITPNYKYQHIFFRERTLQVDTSECRSNASGFRVFFYPLVVLRKSY